MFSDITCDVTSALKAAFELTAETSGLPCVWSSGPLRPSLSQSNGGRQRPCSVPGPVIDEGLNLPCIVSTAQDLPLDQRLQSFPFPAEDPLPPLVFLSICSLFAQWRHVCNAVKQTDKNNFSCADEIKTTNEMPKTNWLNETVNPLSAFVPPSLQCVHSAGNPHLVRCQ